MKISASLYSNKEKSLVELVKDLDRYKIDYYHIDCPDDLTVLEDIARIREISNTPIDLHIISENPEKFFDGIINLKIELVTIQYENLRTKLKIPTTNDTRWGLSIVTETHIDVFSQFQDEFSFILLMTTVPGESGGLFDEINFEKIRRFKDMFPDKLIHVDGGVNEDISFILRTLGVYSAVSGSYLLKAKDIGKSLLTLKTNGSQLEYKVKSFMKKINEIAVVNEQDISLLNILLKISQSKMGFCLITDRDSNLVGLVTDGDIRRALVNNISDLNKIKNVNFINRNPFRIFEEDNIHEMLDKISQQSRNVNFVPVVNNNGRLTGAISFHNLIKGEL